MLNVSVCVQMCMYSAYVWTCSAYALKVEFMPKSKGMRKVLSMRPARAEQCPAYGATHHKLTESPTAMSYASAEHLHVDRSPSRLDSSLSARVCLSVCIRWQGCLTSSTVLKSEGLRVAYLLLTLCSSLEIVNTIAEVSRVLCVVKGGSHSIQRLSD